MKPKIFLMINLTVEVNYYVIKLWHLIFAKILLSKNKVAEIDLYCFIF